MASDLLFKWPAGTAYPVALVLGSQDDTVPLVFGRPMDGAQPVNLVFGDTGDTEEATSADLTADISLPALGVAVLLSQGVTIDAVGAMPALRLAATVEYDSLVSRPLVNQTGVPWQVADQGEIGAQDRAQTGAPLNTGPSASWQIADAVQAGLVALTPYLLVPAPVRNDVPFQNAMPVPPVSITGRHQDGFRDRRLGREGRFQNGVPARSSRENDWQDRYRDRRPSRRVRWSEASTRKIGRAAPFQVADPLDNDSPTIWQEAMKPPAGTSVIVIPVVPPTYCYTPPIGDAAHLLFSQAWTGSSDLLFFCPNHDGPPASIFVPIRRVYMLLNNVSLRRVEGDIALPATDISMSIDTDSWTWGFNAALPAEYLADLEPSAEGAAVELEASINGVAYRFLAEKQSRDRVFRERVLRISGRGKSALLDTPYAPVQSYLNTEERTAQQLMGDVLKINGVSIGWDVDWQITDWLVPTGAFAQQGSFITALNHIAEAGGAYLQPHPTAQEISVLARYPSAPWDWGSVTPDFELPAAVVSREGIEWSDKVRYNRVFVSGTSQGVLGQVTKDGTLGDVLAPMVTHPLITHVDAARQRGLAVLGDTGRQALVSLRMPVLSLTGIITPGKFVRYVDGATTRIGIVRSTQVTVGMPEVWQTLGVETHVS